MSLHLWHRWSKWEAYEMECRVVAQVLAGVSFTAPEPYDFSEVRERRRCEDCGAHQDRLVRNGPMWPSSSPIGEASTSSGEQEER